MASTPAQSVNGTAIKTPSPVVQPALQKALQQSMLITSQALRTPHPIQQDTYTTLTTVPQASVVSNPRVHEKVASAAAVIGWNTTPQINSVFAQPMSMFGDLATGTNAVSGSSRESGSGSSDNQDGSSSGSGQGKQRK